ncbi:hypothetical protein K438DRAFT_2000645 [Mycena galopus ATCC 62051]|nr:hypothetical protein K438DRAFT_2000645 [Mycena galopus ATCC 62051]
MSLQQTVLCFHQHAHVEPCALNRLHYTLNPDCALDGEASERHWVLPKKDKPKKLQLFQHDEEEEQKPKLRVIEGPRSTIIRDLTGPYTQAEKTARHRLITAQREELERAAGWARVLAHIAIVEDVTPAGQLHQQRRRMDVESLARRARKDAKNLAEHKEWLTRHPLPPPPQKIRLINTRGARAPRAEPLTEEELYLDPARPDLIRRPDMAHVCRLCLNAKSHPVKFLCGHTACYVCVRVLLETSWACPQCSHKITRKPKPHAEEAAAIEQEHPGWDKSKVSYSWVGLTFPHTYNRDDIERELVETLGL